MEPVVVCCDQLNQCFTLRYKTHFSSLVIFHMQIGLFLYQKKQRNTGRDCLIPLICSKLMWNTTIQLSSEAQCIQPSFDCSTINIEGFALNQEPLFQQRRTSPRLLILKASVSFLEFPTPSTISALVSCILPINDTICGMLIKCNIAFVELVQ